MAGQDWLEKDFYARLGVPKDASAADVKKAYRRLARTLHPDANADDPTAETRFKEVGEAYAVLSDPDQRRQYDAVRAMGGGARFTSGGAGGAGGAGFEDLLGGLFGGGQRVRFDTGGRGAGPAGGGIPPGLEDLLGGFLGQPGPYAPGGPPPGRGGGGRGPAGFGFADPGAAAVDLEASTEIPFVDAVRGTTLELSVEGRAVRAAVPAGLRDGQKVRLRGKGRPSTDGGPPGDLLLTVTVTPHPVFTRAGDDLRVTLPVTFGEAALGADVLVPTLDGASVRLRVPAGTPSGRTLRVRSRGVTRGATTGDLLVTTQVVVPQRLDDDARAAVEAFAAATGGGDGPGGPRADLMARVAAAAARGGEGPAPAGTGGARGRTP